MYCMSWFRPSCSTEVGAGHMSPLNFLVIHVLHVFFVVVVLLGLWALPCTRLAVKQLGFCCLLSAVCPPARLPVCHAPNDLPDICAVGVKEGVRYKSSFFRRREGIGVQLSNGVQVPMYWRGVNRI